MILTVAADAMPAYEPCQAAPGVVWEAIGRFVGKASWAGWSPVSLLEGRRRILTSLTAWGA